VEPADLGREEQAQALVRTAFSTSVREAGDLSAGVYDVKGQMLAQAVTGTPGHVNAMAESVGHFIRRIGTQNMFEGDVYITNDPWEGTGHLHDITVVTPSFHKGKHVGFFACTAHIVDIGGRGFGADANSVYEEGLHIPIIKLADRGTVNDTLITIVRTNVREPDQVVGDIYALATCNEVGHRRLVDMMDEFGLEDLVAIADFIPRQFPPRHHRAHCRPAQRHRRRADDHRRLFSASRVEGQADGARRNHPG
jgi:N-methylhydantoinase B